MSGAPVDVGRVQRGREKDIMGVRQALQVHQGGGLNVGLDGCGHEDIPSSQ